MSARKRDGLDDFMDMLDEFWLYNQVTKEENQDNFDLSFDNDLDDFDDDYDDYTDSDLTKDEALNKYHDGEDEGFDIGFDQGFDAGYETGVFDFPEPMPEPSNDDEEFVKGFKYGYFDGFERGYEKGCEMSGHKSQLAEVRRRILEEDKPSRQPESVITNAVEKSMSLLVTEPEETSKETTTYPKQYTQTSTGRYKFMRFLKCVGVGILILAIITAVVFALAFIEKAFKNKDSEKNKQTTAYDHTPSHLYN
ncbi:MAG: hypothetical protein J6I46_03110 [Ruminococcus sp.]|nr:hypothetical protein [Ruminococcus sp.]